MTSIPPDEDLYSALQDLFFGKFRGEVVSNEDDQGRGRLEVKVPAVMGAQPIWALPCIPYAGPGEGFYALPPAGANVWIEFEGGDANFPVWVGCFWGDGQIDSADADPKIKFLRTASAAIRIDDGAGTVTIETGDGTVLTIGGGEIKLEAAEINHEGGGAKLSLSAAGLDVNNGAFSVS